MDASLRGDRVLITGARGFMGHHLRAAVRAAGAEVHGVSRIRHGYDGDGVRWWRADMEDAEAVKRTISAVQPDIVYHLSGLAQGGASLDLVLPTFRSLLLGTVNLLSAVTVAGCRRTVLIASLEEPTGDAAEAAPASPYGAAKWAAGAYGRMFHRLYRTPVAVARVFMMYGPHQAEHKVIPYSILSLLDGRPPRLSSGERELDWIYADDVVEGLVHAGIAPGLEGATVDLGSGEATSIREVASEIARLVNPEVLPLFGVMPDHPQPGERARVADTGKAGRLLGWSARTPLREGLARAVEWYSRRRRGEAIA
ncbi:MAG TPA: NAD-dependent epimerase/dehydratase family protein [Methylomirabilota bacterium]|jgi:nucleoside-diphosphate-sugar epimerase